MSCMRCGRELKNGSTFCEDCQAVMDACPVPSGTPVQLPHREAPVTGKKRSARKRREIPPEEQIARLRSSCRWLGIALVVALLAFAFTAGILLQVLNQKPEGKTEEKADKGRNYTTVHRTGR